MWSRALGRQALCNLLIIVQGECGGEGSAVCTTRGHRESKHHRRRLAMSGNMEYAQMPIVEVEYLHVCEVPSDTLEAC
jgi:hypothetical protein